jgi:ornithine cyclodeaminase/alanine dehydrogenase-like protein (mu-crystallin family)
MALLLTHEDVRSVVDMTHAIAAMEAAFLEEGEGRALAPPRTNMKAGAGWLRVGPVALERSGWMGFKAMNLAPGRGVRYQVHLYRIETGELLAIMDAQHLTTLRTGATSAVATRRLAPQRKMQMALLGSGAEARAQLEAMSVAGFVASVRIFSPTPANRERLAAEFRERHGLDARGAASPEEAVEGAELVVAAVKSSEPVLFGRWLGPGVNVVSVGTARRDQREIDEETFRRSARIVVDTREGVFGEAGDAVVAKEAIVGKPVHELAEVVAGKAGGRAAADEVTLFKSVGTGIQDIALAAVIYERAVQRGVGTPLPDFPYLKQS